MKKEDLNKKIEATYEALRLIGRTRYNIYGAVQNEIKVALGKTMMTKITHSIKGNNKRPVSTTRSKHYANTSLIALLIAEKIFPGDKDLQRGIAVCALLHDYGQTPIGHDFESAMEIASKNYNGGPEPHGSIGARRLYYREYKKLEYAINVEPVLVEEAIKRIEGQSKDSKIPNFEKKVKEKVIELKENINQRREPELLKRIEENKKKNENLTKNAIELLIMSAGNHNGERGIAHIIPDYSITFEEFWKNIENTFLDKNANDKLQTCTIADGIAKLSDQISSIVFDIIDGVRSGLEDSIPTDWIKPVSQVLQITEEETKKRFQGDDKKLALLALEIQDKLIESVCKNSSKTEINMDLSDLLYESLRRPNFTHHIIYTSTEKEEIILYNIAIKLTDKLSSLLIDDKGVFLSDLNAIFRLSRNNSSRENEELDLKDKYNKKDPLFKNFYEYIIETSSEEYNDYKKRIKKQEMKYFRGIIEDALNKVNSDTYFIPRRDNNKMKYVVQTAMTSGKIDIIKPNKNGKYEDEDIQQMIDNINAYLRKNPIDGIDNLNVTVQRTIYDIGKQISEYREIGRDEQIAAQMAISYMQTFNDEQLLNFAYNLGIISKKERDLFFIPYEECSAKRTGNSSYMSAAATNTLNDYNDAKKKSESNLLIRRIIEEILKLLYAKIFY